MLLNVKLMGGEGIVCCWFFVFGLVWFGGFFVCLFGGFFGGWGLLFL